MAEADETTPLAPSGRAELALGSPKPVSLELAAAAVLELGSDRETTECYESVDGLPGLCATRVVQREMVF